MDRKRWLGGLTLVVALSAPSCSGRGNAAVGPDVVLGPHTKVLDAETLGKLESVSSDRSVLSFSSSTKQLDGVVAGDVLVAPMSAVTPVGLLRKATKVDRGSGVVVTTDSAGLADAFQRAHVVLHQDLSMLGAPTDSSGVHLKPQGSPSAGGGLVFGVNDVVLYDFDGDQATTTDQVRLSGNVSLNPSIDLDLQIDDFALKSATFTLSGEQSSSLDVTVDAGYSFDESKDFEAFIFPPITIPVGVVPLVFVPDLKIKFGVEGNLSVPFEEGATESASFKAGVGYQNGVWGPIRDGNFSAQLNPPQIGGKLRLRTYAGPELNLLLYGVVGPHVDLEGYLALDGDTDAHPCWNLHGGLDSTLGVKVDVLDVKIADYDTTINLYDKSIANGDCGSSLPPDTFWSKVYQQKVLTPESVRFVSTVDGGALVVAQFADLVFKVDARGNVLWQQQFTNFHDVRDVVVLPDGTSAVVGSSAGGWLAKLDSSGAILWSKKYVPEGGATLEGTALALSGDGGFFLAGNTQASDGNLDGWIARTNGDGVIAWSRRIGGKGFDSVEAIARATNGDAVVVGTNGAFQGMAVSSNPNGDLVWQWQYGGLATVQSLTALAQAPGGGWLFGGSIQQGPERHGWFVRTASDGALLHDAYGSSQYHRQNPDEAYFSQIVVRGLAASLEGDDTYFGVGSIWDGINTASRQFWAFRIALSGDGTANMLWSRAFDAPGEDLGYAVAQLSDKTLLMGGTTQSLGSEPGGSIWLLRTQQNGLIKFAQDSGVTLTSLTGRVFQAESYEAPDGGPSPVPVVTSKTSLDSRDLPLATTDDPLALLGTALSVRAVAP